MSLTPPSKLNRSNGVVVEQVEAVETVAETAEAIAMESRLKNVTVDAMSLKNEIMTDVAKSFYPIRKSFIFSDVK